MSNLVRKALGRSSWRLVYSLVGGTLFGLWGAGRGWPWWLAVPAALVMALCVFLLTLSLLYTYTKSIYLKRAEEVRRRIRELTAERDGTAGGRGCSHHGQA